MEGNQSVGCPVYTVHCTVQLGCPVYTVQFTVQLGCPVYTVHYSWVDIVQYSGGERCTVYSTAGQYGTLELRYPVYSTAEVTSVQYSRGPVQCTVHHEQYGALQPAVKQNNTLVRQRPREGVREFCTSREK